jgi:WD40 repeat protein
MNTSFQRMLGIACVAAGTLCAQQGRVSGPTTGFVFDPSSHKVRPILGVPGGSTIGSPVDLGGELASAWVSPRLDSAIGVTAEGALHVFRIDSGSVAPRTVDGVDGTVGGVVFSPIGSSALLVTANATYVLAGLPDAPKVSGTVTPGSLRRRATPAAIGVRASAPNVSWALSDDGAYVLYGEGGSVRVLTVSGENRQLAVTAADAVVAFAPGSHDAAIADSDSGLVVFRNLAGAAAPKVVGRLSSPSGLAFSPDSKRVFVASAAEHAVNGFDVESGARTTLACDCSPASLVRMGNVYRLNELGREPLWILDADAKDPRIVFVPAAVN